MACQLSLNLRCNNLERDWIFGPEGIFKYHCAVLSTKLLSLPDWVPNILTSFKILYAKKIHLILFKELLQFSIPFN